MPLLMAGKGRGLSVVRSITCSSVVEPLSTTTAMRLPSDDNSNPPRPLLLLPTSITTALPVTGVQTHFASSHRQTRKSQPDRAVRA